MNPAGGGLYADICVYIIMIYIYIQSCMYFYIVNNYLYMIPQTALALEGSRRRLLEAI